MGSAQSARKLTVLNEEEMNMINISDKIAKRLNDGLSVPVSKTTEEVKAEPAVQAKPTNVLPPQSTQTGDLPSPGYPVYYYPELTLTALQIQQQKEQELLNQDHYWQKRLQNLEKNHLKINRIIEEEYKKAIGELYINGQKVNNFESNIQPCLENTEKVLKCYQEHPKEILQCSSLVEEFSNCVDQRRARVIAARC